MPTFMGINYLKTEPGQISGSSSSSRKLKANLALLLGWPPEGSQVRSRPGSFPVAPAESGNFGCTGIQAVSGISGLVPSKPRVYLRAADEICPGHPSQWKPSRTRTRPRARASSVILCPNIFAKILQTCKKSDSNSNGTHVETTMQGDEKGGDDDEIYGSVLDSSS